ncbi:MAG: hypothetical protein GY797_25080, partial [Deltaproteobacteria bacterium]|nr:hypothetical protein [Deltaproteobacteria bacterium]
PIVPYDANPNDKQTFLGSDIIQKALDKIDAHETIFIIDACYSGRLARAGSKALNEKGLTEGLSKSLIDEVAQTEEEAQKKVSSNVTRVIMTSSDEDQKSVGLPNKKNGLFTYYLMNTLIQHPGEADTKPHDGKLSLAEVYQDVYKAVTENRLKKADFIITEDTLKQLKSEEVPREVLKKLEMHFKDEKITGLEEFLKRLEKTAIGKGNLRDYKELILKYTKISVQTPRISNDEKAQQIIVFIINELEELPAPDIADSNFDIGQIIMEDADREFIESDPMGMYSIKKDETVTIQVEFFNPDKHNLEVAWTARYGRISPFSRKIS